MCKLPSVVRAVNNGGAEFSVNYFDASGDFDCDRFKRDAAPRIDGEALWVGFGFRPTYHGTGYIKGHAPDREDNHPSYIVYREDWHGYDNTYGKALDIIDVIGKVFNL